MFDDITVALSVPNTSPASAMSPVPITVRPRKSGSAKVVCPFPPYMVPSRANKAWFWLIGSSWPSAFAQPLGAKSPANAITSPRICCPSRNTPLSRDGKMTGQGDQVGERQRWLMIVERLAAAAHRRREDCY